MTPQYKAYWERAPKSAQSRKLREVWVMYFLNIGKFNGCALSLRNLFEASTFTREFQDLFNFSKEEAEKIRNQAFEIARCSRAPGEWKYEMLNSSTL